MNAVAGITEVGIVVCVGCGCVHQEATDLLSQLQEDVSSLERELRSKRATIKRLQSDQADAMQASPLFPVAMKVLEMWRRLCQQSARELNGKRLENALARLKGGYTEQQLNEASLGYSKFPYVVGGKRSQVGSPREWYADAELVFRTPQHVDVGIRMSHKDDTQVPQAILARINWRAVKRANRDLIVQNLEAQFGKGFRDDINHCLSWPCPRCSDEDGRSGVYSPPLRVARDDEGAGDMVECRGCGLRETEMIRAIRESA